MKTLKGRRDPPGESVHFEIELKGEQKEEHPVFRILKLILRAPFPLPSSFRITYKRNKR